MRQTSNGNSSSLGRTRISPVLLSAMLMASVSLTGCANLLEEFKATEEATAALLPKIADKGPGLPDIPAGIRTCLMKQACQMKAEDAKKVGRPAPDCVTADGILLAYVQTDAEKRSCSRSLFVWWRKQQQINAEKDRAADAAAAGHPKVSKPAKAGWP